ncbi:MAG TPA: Maf family protein [Steroidobacteraceae bacterium]|nr:Maf family protein [Steroidobacteraceae bacterium]
MASKTLYLASASPRRRALLDQIGVEYQARPVQVDESRQPREPPRDYVIRLARAKAETAWTLFGPDAARAVLAADTAVVLADSILGKPRDRSEALAMLGRLSGRMHEVFTAVALRTERGLESRVSASRVKLRELKPDEIESYWDTGEPSDKAGAYAIQGRAAVFIETLEGSYSGVMGLPLFETAELLVRAGIGTWMHRHAS